MKLYKITKGIAANSNAVMIEPIVGNMESFTFVNKVRLKAIDLFGVGASLDTISTNFGVSFRFVEYKYNLKMAKLLIRVVTDEQTLISMKNGE